MEGLLHRARHALWNLRRCDCMMKPKKENVSICTYKHTPGTWLYILTRGAPGTSHMSSTQSSSGSRSRSSSSKQQCTLHAKSSQSVLRTYFIPGVTYQVPGMFAGNPIICSHLPPTARRREIDSQPTKTFAATGPSTVRYTRKVPYTGLCTSRRTHAYLWYIPGTSRSKRFHERKYFLPTSTAVCTDNVLYCIHVCMYDARVTSSL